MDDPNADSVDNNYDASQAGGQSASAVPSSSNGIDFNSLLQQALKLTPTMVQSFTQTPAGNNPVVKPTTTLKNGSGGSAVKVTGIQKYLGWIIGGGALLVVAVVALFMFQKKKGR